MKLLTDQRFGMWQEMTQIWRRVGEGIWEVETTIVPIAPLDRVVFESATAIVIDDPWAGE